MVLVKNKKLTNKVALAKRKRQDNAINNENKKRKLNAENSQIYNDLIDADILSLESAIDDANDNHKITQGSMNEKLPQDNLQVNK